MSTMYFINRNHHFLTSFVVRKALLFLSFFFAFCLHLQAKQPQELMREGNAFYKTKDFRQAISSYEKVLESDFESAELYYNLGNAYYRMNDYPFAILNYERALRLSPSDPDIQMNLKIANAKIVDKIDELPDFFLVKWFNSAVNFYSFNTWATLCIVFVFILCAGVCIYFLSDRYNVKRGSFFGGIVLLFFAVLSFLFANLQYSDYKSKDNAVITQALVVVKSSPDQSSLDKFVIHAGTKVHIEDALPDWLKIKLQNGNIGWIEKNALEII